MFLWRGEIGSMTEEVESEFFRSWPLAAEFEVLLPPHTQKCVGAHVLHVLKRRVIFLAPAPVTHVQGTQSYVRALLGLPPRPVLPRPRGPVFRDCMPKS